MKTPSERIAFTGEQILSYFDELTRLACPRCEEQRLTVTLVGNSLVVRCSESLNEWNESGEQYLTDICDYVQIVRQTSVTREPFNFKFNEPKGRPTLLNVPIEASIKPITKPKRTTRRKRNT